jgi:DNA replication licensing factor MCM4
LLAERRGNRLSVRDVTKQLAEISDLSMSQNEIVDALKRLAADGIIQYNERNQTVVSRSGLVS